MTHKKVFGIQLAAGEVTYFPFFNGEGEPIPGTITVLQIVEVLAPALLKLEDDQSLTIVFHVGCVDCATVAPFTETELYPTDLAEYRQETGFEGDSEALTKAVAEVICAEAYRRAVDLMFRPQGNIMDIMAQIGRQTRVIEVVVSGNELYELLGGLFVAAQPAPNPEPTMTEEELLRVLEQEFPDDDNFDWLIAAMEEDEAELLAQLLEQQEEPGGPSWKEWEEWQMDENKPDGTPVEDWEHPEGYN